MPVRPKRRRRNDSPFHLRNLSGRDATIAAMCGTGWKPTDKIQSAADLEQVWQQNRSQFLTMKTAANNWQPYGFDPGTRPPLWWLFEAEEPPLPGESQEQCLHRLGILTDVERSILDRQRQHEKVEQRELRLHREQAAADAAIKVFHKRF